MMISDLPSELESEILSRVPAKSLAKLKPTCKRWYALFKDPSFVKKNIRKTAAANEVLLLTSSGVYSVSGDLHGIQNIVDPSIDLTGKLKDSKDLEIREMIPCDGLLLCVRKAYNEIVVWNPCTGQTKWIKPKNRYSCDYYYSFGYGNSKSSSSSSRCYKILRLVSSYKGRRQIVTEIYEFSSDSWRVLDDIKRNWSIQSNVVTLNGNSYWFATDDEEPFAKFILMFDFTTESFHRLSIPLFQTVGCVQENVALSVVRDDKLVLLRQGVVSYVDDMFSFDMKIWMADTYKSYEEGKKDLSWTNVLEVDFSHFLISIVTSFLFDEEDKVAACCFTDIKDDDDRTRIYIVGENLRKKVYKEKAAVMFNSPYLISYVPNLVHIDISNTPKRPKRKREPRPAAVRGRGRGRGGKFR